MATQSIPQPHTTPVFAPDGTIAQIPDQYLPDAMSHGGKLAVQMKTPDGAMHYVPHDQVRAAQLAGGQVNPMQGTPDAPKPAEGFWHSLGSVLGLTPEAYQTAKQKAAGMNPVQEALSSTAPPNPVAVAKNAVTAVAHEFQKGSKEGQESYDALQQGDVKAFLAHQIGQAGHAGAAVLAPIAGENISKAGEQLGEGNIAGAAGTTTGVLAPAIADAGVSAVAKVPLTKIVKSAAVVGEPIPVVGSAIERLQRYKAAPQRLRDIWAKQAEAEAATAEGTAAGPVPSGEPAPAPYRLSGNQIQDATTVTPRRILGPDRQLPAAPAEATAAAPAAPPKTGQVLKDAGVTQAMKEAGIAAPSASARAVRPGVTAQLAPRADIQFPPGLSGEDASLMQLTRYNINELRFMANKRGLPVSPKDTHTALIDKIQGSLTPDETAGFTAAAQATKITPSKFPDNNLMAQNLNDAATALQQAKGSPYEIASLRNAASRIQQHPESIAAVDLTKTKIPGVDKRIGKRIADFLEQQKAVPGTDDQAAGAAAAGNGGGLSMLDALRQSLIQRGIKPPY